MNANLNFPSISTFSPNGGNVVPNPTPTDGDPKAEEFAAVLTGQMFKAERQGLAAQVFGGPSLQVVSLGTKLNVITTDEPLPDLPSLATFARSQGLDEIAIQALFGPTAGPKSDITISGVGQPYATKSAPGRASATPLVLLWMRGPRGVAGRAGAAGRPAGMTGAMMVSSSSQEYSSNV